MSSGELELKNPKDVDTICIIVLGAKTKQETVYEHEKLLLEMEISQNTIRLTSQAI